MRVVNVDGRWYLEAWCRLVEDVRLFRLDRVLDAVELDLPAEVPVSASPRDVSGGLYLPALTDPEVVLDLARESRWVADYYPYESYEERPGGGVRVALRVHDDGWLRRLLLRLGPAATVVSPPSLADDVRRTAARALAAYGTD
jgi:proteasome accessory factor C